ncbi:hypothetical protein FF38_10581 [Lucilia cuprina]|uniref:Uncharacterized protein n=1 Tax=Lucilia cuprina TaxID=7375 RepID=A0A0L0CDC9_LUCCU|nr:hypothetical protein FF38_10581 [Lucilia cuprina]
MNTNSGESSFSYHVNNIKYVKYGSEIKVNDETNITLKNNSSQQKIDLATYEFFVNVYTSFSNLKESILGSICESVECQGSLESFTHSCIRLVPLYNANSPRLMTTSMGSFCRPSSKPTLIHCTGDIRAKLEPVILRFGYQKLQNHHHCNKQIVLRAASAAFLFTQAMLKIKLVHDFGYPSS